MADEFEPETERRVGSGLTLAEKVAVPLALTLLVGWTYTYVKNAGSAGDSTPPVAQSWFELLSIISALAIVVLVTLKAFEKLFMPRRLYRPLLSIACLLPFVGLLIAQLGSVGTTLTVWASVALAYLAATTFWRNHIPRILLDPLRQGDREDRDSQADAATTATGAAAETSPAQESDVETTTDGPSAPPSPSTAPQLPAESP